MLRETSNLEFKVNIDNGFQKTVSAFANFGTGTVVFGIEDKTGAVIGLEGDLFDLCLRLEQKINTTMMPVPRFGLTVDEERRTISLVVYQGEDTPYLYNGKAYRRADSSSVEVDRFELNRLVLKGMNTSYDALPAKQQEFSFSALEAELRRSVGIETVDENALISLELKTPSREFNNAAALLADENSLPGIDIARLGDSINIILFRKQYEHCSVITQLEKALEVFDDNYVYEEIVGFKRERKELIPREAFREAVANALVHRSWDTPAQIGIQMFPDRVEILSPGGLPEGTSVDSYLSGGLSVSRNPIVANLFYRLGYIERFGTGIPRIKACYAPLAVSPAFQVNNSSVTVILPVNSTVALTADERVVLEAIPKGVSVYRAEVEIATKLSKDRVIRALNSLGEKGFVFKSGSSRATKYNR